MVENLEAASPLVIFDQAVFVQDVGCRVHQVHPAPLQQRVRTAVVMGHAVQGRVAEHANVQVGVAEPVHSILEKKLHQKCNNSRLASYACSANMWLHDIHLCVLHISQDDLSIEHVRQLAHHLTLYGQLLVEQRQVVLQLSMGRDQNTLTLGVVLRTASSTKHLIEDMNNPD